MTKQVPVIRVVAAIIEYDGQYLACRRAPHKASAGLWEFPGGKIEPGESPEDALVREIEEELNLKIDVVRHFHTAQTIVEGSIIQLECYLATACFMPTLSTDHDDMRLTNVQEFQHLSWADPDLPAVRKLLSVGSRIS